MFRIKSYVILGIVTLLCATHMNAQNTPFIIHGKVVNTKGKPIPFAAVAIKNSSQGTVTNENGDYQIETNQKVNKELIIRCIGYQENTSKLPQKLRLNTTLNFSLKASSTNINEVIVAEKSERTKLKEMPCSLSAIDAKPLQVKNLDVNQILNTSSEIRIREEGGLGSNFSFSLNGFTGNQVKYFMDGVPMDNFGSSLSLNNIPINLISSTEVYKGVLEMMQDVTHIRSLTGSQKLLPWDNSNKKEEVAENSVQSTSENPYGVSKDSIIAPLLKKHPYLKKLLISLSPKYKQLSNPVVFNTMGNIASLEMIAARGDLKTEELVEKLLNKIKEEEEEEDA